MTALIDAWRSRVTGLVLYVLADEPGVVRTSRSPPIQVEWNEDPEKVSTLRLDAIAKILGAYPDYKIRYRLRGAKGGGQ